jgi:hypothetical protein
MLIVCFSKSGQLLQNMMATAVKQGQSFSRIGIFPRYRIFPASPRWLNQFNTDPPPDGYQLIFVAKLFGFFRLMQRDLTRPCPSLLPRD